MSSQAFLSAVFPSREQVRVIELAVVAHLFPAEPVVLIRRPGLPLRELLDEQGLSGGADGEKLCFKRAGDVDGHPRRLFRVAQRPNACIHAQRLVEGELFRRRDA